MRFTIIVSISIGILLAFSACNFNVAVKSGLELKGEGVTFLVPTETSGATSGTGGISYTGKKLEASTDGKTLMVNGQDYGSLKTGDVVDFREKGKVFVNGAERGPMDKAIENEKPADAEAECILKMADLEQMVVTFGNKRPGKSLPPNLLEEIHRIYKCPSGGAYTFTDKIPIEKPGSPAFTKCNLEGHIFDPYNSTNLTDAFHASVIANKQAKQQFGEEPFLPRAFKRKVKSESIVFIADVSFGSGDLKAEVNFTESASPVVELTQTTNALSIGVRESLTGEQIGTMRKKESSVKKIFGFDRK